MADSDRSYGRLRGWRLFSWDAGEIPNDLATMVSRGAVEVEILPKMTVAVLDPWGERGTYGEGERVWVMPNELKEQVDLGRVRLAPVPPP